MQIFFKKLQQLHIALNSMSTHHRTCMSKLRFSFKNGFKRLHPVNTLVRCEHNLYFLWNHFKHIGDSQYLEIVTASKEIMSFHDHGVVVFRFGRSHNESTRNTALSYPLVKRGLWFVINLVDVSGASACISWIFSLGTSCNEHRTISGSVLLNFSSHISNQT